MNNVISISDLYVSVSGKNVLDGVNLCVNQGENLVLLGGSGSGKSTLIKVIFGFLKCSKGNVKIEGKEIFSSVEKNVKLNGIGMVFQHNALFDSLTIWENISFGLLQKYKIKRSDAKKKAIEQLKLVSLDEELADKFPSELSGGMQKRIAIIRTVILKPKIIVFDEPTGGLDPIMSELIAKLIAHISSNITTITITHDMRVAKLIADKIAMLHEGKIIFYGSFSGMELSKNKYIQKFIA